MIKKKKKQNGLNRNDFLFGKIEKIIITSEIYI